MPSNPRSYYGRRVYMTHAEQKRTEKAKARPIAAVEADEVLHLTLKRQWFDLIALGQKKQEYRDNTPHWRTRLKDRHYTHVQFRNGYKGDCPKMLVELKRIYYDPQRKGGGKWVVELGNVIAIEHWEGPKNDAVS